MARSGPSFYTRLERGSVLSLRGALLAGLDTHPPTADWGSMHPNVVLLPGRAAFVIVWALNLVGGALRDLLDTRGYSR